MPAGITVVHLKRDTYDVRIDRAGPWGNPFLLDNPRDDAARAEVLREFRQWLRWSDDPQAMWMRSHITDLAGKTLGCWCAPRPCHGDVLAELCAERTA